MSLPTSPLRIWFLCVTMSVAIFAAWRSASLGQTVSNKHRATPEFPTGELRINEPTSYFEREGFFHLTPPIHLPGRKSGKSKTEIWLKLPSSPGLEVESRENGDFSLIFPPGSHLARVESERRKSGKWWVADVRATRLDERGEWFQVYRPTSLRADAELVGVEWRRGELNEQRLADDWVSTIAGDIQTSVERSHRAAQKARTNNDCAGCHQYKRANAVRWREFGPVHRGTDGSGFFVPHFVLRSEAPLEDYAPREMNLERPFVSVSCPEGELLIQGETPFRKPICAKRQVPYASFEVETALGENDATARAVCESRRYLLAHMSADARGYFREESEECSKIFNRGETDTISTP